MSAPGFGCFLLIWLGNWLSLLLEFESAGSLPAKKTILGAVCVARQREDLFLGAVPCGTRCSLELRALSKFPRVVALKALWGLGLKHVLLK